MSGRTSGLERVALPWAKIDKAFPARVNKELHLAVRTKASPVEGAALTSRRYQKDISGFLLRSLAEVDAPAGQLLTAIAAHATVTGETPGGTSST
ncbi:hypothetical protein [Dactylosporangium sp. CA-139066]|uniref:hypothetical protein n=1 Tax=Dactylosporangium sp. CA-139066 TaxID=3239930 RepID=UPI003D909EC2